MKAFRLTIGVSLLLATFQAVVAQDYAPLHNYDT